MANVLFLKLVKRLDYGLCNQLLSLVSGIIHCIKQKYKLLIVDKFLTEINSNTYCSISYVFDLKLMNNYLKKYNLYIVDGFNINSRAFRPISWDVITLAKEYNNRILLSFIDEIYKNIYFQEKFIKYSNKFINENITDINNKSVNVIHLRIEDDALKHWSSINYMTVIEFKQMLINKYINLINEYIKKDDITIILSGEINNKVVDYMKKYNYNVIFVDKKFDTREKTRELNAIIDLMIGKYCNNVFIGCGGSTFSELLHKKINDTNTSGSTIKKYMFDLNNIKI